MTAEVVMAIGLSVTSVSITGTLCFVIHRYTKKDSATDKSGFPMLVPLSGSLGDMMGPVGPGEAPKEPIKDMAHGNYA